MVGRGVSINFDHPRAVALVSEVEGVFVVEPMRFLFPFEARREAAAAERPKGNPARCHHRHRRAIREARP